MDMVRKGLPNREKGLDMEQTFAQVKVGQRFQMDGTEYVKENDLGVLVGVCNSKEAATGKWFWISHKDIVTVQ